MRYVRPTAIVVVLMLSVTACAGHVVGRTIGFTVPANPCTLLSPDDVAHAGGPAGLTAEKDPVLNRV
jgi:hypothetical protein